MEKIESMVTAVLLCLALVVITAVGIALIATAWVTRDTYAAGQTALADGYSYRRIAP